MKQHHFHTFLALHNYSVVPQYAHSAAWPYLEHLHEVKLSEKQD
jgi:hypothetical protein